MLRHCLAALSVTLPAIARASEPVPGPAGMLQMLPGLLFVLALIGALAWAARRFGAGRSVAPSHIRTVASASVGTRERVVIVEIAGEWMVLGVAPGRVDTIARMARPATATVPDTPAAPAFLGALAQAMKKS
ncbi:MAG: flagellar biosynthetic protein FliO [Burkholderiales bacterium]|nr:flagellar biosynthetic protein FliO [Burkholderiales bacterium]